MLVHICYWAATWWRPWPTRKERRSNCVLNTVAVQTAQFTLDNTQIISAANLTDELTQAFGEQNLARINATAICEKLFGNAIAANLFLVGYAFQLGLIPIGEAAIFGAIALNGIDVDMNQRTVIAGNRALEQRGNYVGNQ